MNILFVCKHNRFRSKIAEAIFKKLNKNPRIHASSAGLIMGGRTHKDVFKAAKAFGLGWRVKQHYLTNELLRQQDIIVVVADNVHPSLFYDGIKPRAKMVWWKIPDYSGEGVEPRRKRMVMIQKKMGALLKEFAQK